MEIINYNKAEKRLKELEEITSIKELCYLNVLSFMVNENGNYIKDVDLSISILFKNEIQLIFKKKENNKFCKFEFREKNNEFQITAFLYENKNIYPVINNIELDKIFYVANCFFEKNIIKL